MNIKQISAGVAVVVVLGVASWYVLSHGGVAGMAGASATSSVAVATVNGEKVTRGDLDTAEGQLSEQEGVEATTTEAQAQLQSQAMDSLVGRVLLRQAAHAAGVVASSTEVDAQLASAKSQFASDAEYQQALAQEGLTEAELTQRISDDVLINDYLEQTLSLSKVTATNAEIQAAYNAAVAGQTGMPALADVRDQVEQSVIQQKQGELVNAEIAKLRAAGQVQILI